MGSHFLFLDQIVGLLAGHPVALEIEHIVHGLAAHARFIDVEAPVEFEEVMKIGPGIEAASDIALLLQVLSHALDLGIQGHEVVVHLV
jgi:hypothetical protein